MRTLIIAVLLLSAVVWSAPRRDPLTQAEIEQMRETAMDPERRLPLIIEFARLRLANVERMRSDPRMAADRGVRVHDLLEDFTRLIDELGDNIDQFTRYNADIRKPLKLVIEAQNEFQIKLRSIKATQNDAVFGKEYRDYAFVVDSAIEAVTASLEDNRKLLQEQEALAAEKKLRKLTPP